MPQHPAKLAQIPPPTLEELLRHIEDCAALLRYAADSASTNPESLGRKMPLDQPLSEANARAIAQFDRTCVTALLRRPRGNISLASRLCGTERSRFTTLVKKYGLVAQPGCQEQSQASADDRFSR